MLEVKNLNKTFPTGVQALKDVSFSVKEGEFLVIIGLSGSGKSTLLKSINRLLPFNSGKIFFQNKDTSHLASSDLRAMRSQMGMIFQHFNLIPRKSVLTNVLAGSLSRTGIIKSILGIYSDEERQMALNYIEVVGLSDKANSRADQLSGGQQQRVAIARALMQNPKLILADEPVASLDPATSNTVMQYLKKVNVELGVTVICNLHFLSLVREYAHRVIALKSGSIIYDGKPKEISNEWFKKIYGEDAVEVTIN
jgi:phosphonate transport system ATP-binding protein